MDVERHNLAQIESLNQRGGRTLSVLDLVEAGTVSAEMAAFCWLAVAAGDSFLTGAVPGGVGKTTLMAALLGFLPPGERIVTVASHDAIERALAGDLEPPATLLPHEIGRGRWYGYIWGRAAADFLGLSAQGIRRVSCLHSDDPEETRAQLVGLGASPEDVGRIGFQAYMLAERRAGVVRRRVRGLHVARDGASRLVFRWDAETDGFECLPGRQDAAAELAHRLRAGPDDTLARWRECRRLLEGWLDAGVRRFEDVRAHVADAYTVWGGDHCAPE